MSDLNEKNVEQVMDKPKELPPIAVRMKRNMTALSLHEPDRVPFMPSMNNFYAMHYGVSIQESMTDARSLIVPLKKFCEDYDPDWVWNPVPFPIKPMETIGHKQARWPGAYWNLPENTPYQYVDHSYLSEDDWEEYFSDPTLYIAHKVLPNKYENLKGLQFINPFAMCGHAILSFAQFANPMVKDSLRTLLQVADEVDEYMQGGIALTMSVIENGYPVYGSAPACVPFDDFADNIRGLMELCMDIITDPDEVDEALEKLGEITIPAAIATCKMSHCDTLFMPLHCGVDNFMSLDSYEEFYWPGLKKLLLADKKPAVMLLYMAQTNGATAQNSHVLVGFHYNLPMVSYANCIKEMMAQEHYTAAQLSGDEVHPSAVGHAIVGEILWNYLNQVYEQKDSLPQPSDELAEPLTNTRYELAGLLDRKTLTPDENVGFQEAERTKEFPNGWVTEDGTGEITFTVDFKNLGILYQKTTDGKSGQYDVWIDGEKVCTLNADFTGGWGNAITSEEVYRSDTTGTHTVTIRKAEDSQGDTFILLGLLPS